MAKMRHRGSVLVLAAAGTDWHVPHGSSGGPISLAMLAEVARLVDVVVVVVAELGVHAVASRAWKHLVWFLWSFVL